MLFIARFFLYFQKLSVSISPTFAYTMIRLILKGMVEMEFIQIGGTKIKVMLAKEDMQRFSLDSMNIDYENVETRRAFRKILDEVKQQTGFDIAFEQVLVQVYPSRDGGCELFVSKLPNTGKESQPYSHATREITMLSLRQVVYAFSALEHLLRAVLEIKKRKHSTASSLYKVEGGEWLLLLEERVLSGTKRHAGELSFLEEFAVKKIGSLRLAYIKEHAKCIISERAVETLVKAFD